MSVSTDDMCIVELLLNTLQPQLKRQLQALPIIAVLMMRLPQTHFAFHHLYPSTFIFPLSSSQIVLPYYKGTDMKQRIIKKKKKSFQNKSLPWLFPMFAFLDLHVTAFFFTSGYFQELLHVVLILELGVGF